MFLWSKLFLKSFADGFLTKRSLVLENLALRQQLMVLHRNKGKPRFRETDRVFWVLYSRFVNGWQRLLKIARPRTVIDWQKRRFRRFWRKLCQRSEPGRPKIEPEIRELILTMNRANPTWGTPRIIGELGKLGITVCKVTVDRYRIRRNGPPSPSWKTFLANEGKAISGIDFFTVPTATFRVLYVFVVLLHERRQVVHFNVTENPTAGWTAQQIVEAFPWDTAPKYLLRDNDCIYMRTILRPSERNEHQGNQDGVSISMAKSKLRKDNWINTPRLPGSRDHYQRESSEEDVIFIFGILQLCFIMPH